jgi:hypothetical protein
MPIHTLRTILHNPHLCDFLKLGRPMVHWSAQKGATEAWVLKTLNSYPDGLHKRINDRHALSLRIAAAATPDGRLFVEESGMDCDCVRYSGRIREIEATVRAYCALDNHIGAWSDGPYRLRLVTQSEAERIQPQSRDLALEAFENGHRHYITLGDDHLSSTL